jgi:formylglycine-generating enzyme required for sulfatase activity
VQPDKRWMKLVACCLWVALHVGVHAWGIEITAISRDGVLSWTHPTNGIQEYCIEQCADLSAGVWDELLADIAPTSEVMSVDVDLPATGRFYRVKAFLDDSMTVRYVVVDLSPGPSADTYDVDYLTDIPPGGWTDEHKSTKLVLRRIEAGSFAMGSPTNELGRVSNEDQHTVTLTQGFFIGVFPVTQKQWERVMGTWPSYFSNEEFRNTRPVEKVSYDMVRGSGVGAEWPAGTNVDANSFMGRMRTRSGLHVDLPTEAQWEYAARAGTTTALNTGTNLTAKGKCPNLAEAGRYWHNGGQYVAGYPNRNTDAGTAAVGAYLANNWGFYDFHGNVWEWCLDWYGAYPGGPVDDPEGPELGEYRVARGGSWDEFWTVEASRCRSAYRLTDLHPDSDYYDNGFRIALPFDIAAP